MRGPSGGLGGTAPYVFAQAPATSGHGMGNCSARDRPAMRTCSASTGTATQGYQGTSLAEGTFPPL